MKILIDISFILPALGFGEDFKFHAIVNCSADYYTC